MLSEHIINQKNEKANAEINMAAVIASGAGAANPIPLAGDVVILIGIWSAMLFRMAKIYEVEFDEKGTNILLKQAFRSVGWYALGTMFFVGITKSTGIGTGPAMVANAGLNFAFTKAVGHMYQQAWIEGRTPTKDELIQGLQNAHKGQ